MELTIAKAWVDCPEYHNLTSPAKLALWEVVALVSANKPKGLKELAFKLRVPQENLQDALNELEEAGFASEQDGLWFCHFVSDNKKIISSGGNAARQARHREKKKQEANSEFLSGHGADLKEGQAVEVERKAREAVDYQAVVDMFHERCPKLPGVSRVDDKRQRLIKKAWFEFKKSCDGSKEQVLALFGMFFDKVGASSFLCGERNKVGSAHEKWIASLDFVLKSDQFTKIIDGGHDDR